VLPEVNGVGLGLRFPHFDTILHEKPNTPWFEVITDDFLTESPATKKLEQLRSNYPITFHSVGLNLGGVDEFDLKYLNRFKDLYTQFEPNLISDHLCWSSHNGKFHHDLMPIPKFRDAVKNLIKRINFLQDFFKRELVVENITQYIKIENEDYSEQEYLEEIISKTNCKLLLDISNVLINVENKIIPSSWIDSFPLEHVAQIHLSGGEVSNDLVIDTHGERVGSKDIEILKEIYDRGFKIPSIIERDTNLEPFALLENERKEIEKSVHGL
jgi:uncharacterized protein (UPF0276 family)